MKIANFEKSDKYYKKGGHGILGEAGQGVTHPSRAMPNRKAEGHGRSCWD